jgi:NAD+ synthase
MMNAVRRFDRSALTMDCAAAAREIEAGIQGIVVHDLHRQGVVLGVSGGIDSAVCAALAVRALGPRRVMFLLMPEKESSPDSTRRGRMLCETLGVEPVLENITPALTALGCYDRRDNAIRRLVPGYSPGWRQKIGLSGSLLDNNRLNYFTLTVETPDGERITERMPAETYLEVVAATNLKQRVRKTVEYTHADRLNYAVLGTPNRLEYELGFFVRGGDGLADLKPIAHLYKSQVYQLAEYLGVPGEIRRQTPSTDTYSLPQTQEEFYYALPYDVLDLALCAHGQGVAPAEAAPALAMSAGQVQRVYQDIERKQRTSARGLRDAVLVSPVHLPPAHLTPSHISGSAA